MIPCRPAAWVVLNRFLATRAVSSSKPKKEKIVTDIVPPPEQIPAVKVVRTRKAKEQSVTAVFNTENITDSLVQSIVDDLPILASVKPKKETVKAVAVEVNVSLPKIEPVKAVSKKEKVIKDPTVVKKEKPTPVIVETPPLPPPSTPVIIQPQVLISQNNALLNFPLCADHSEPEMASLLAKDRVIEFGLKRYPSVGAVMRETQTPQQIFLLKRWREKKIAELGSESEFTQYVQRIKSEGERLHNCLRLFLSANMPEKELPLTDSLRLLWHSFRPVLDKISSVCAVETAVHHKPLGYTGIADCIAIIDGQLVLIDWKVSERQRSSLAQTYDTPIQIIAYIGAMNAHYALNEAEKLDATKRDKMEPGHLYIPPKAIRHGLAVIGYRDGSPAHVHVMDEGTCEIYWQKWLEKVHAFWAKKLSPPSTPPGGPPTSAQ